MYFDEEDIQEMEAIENIDENKIQIIDNLEKEKERYSKIATHTIKTMNKRKNICIRVFEDDITKLKVKAQEL